MNIFIFLFTVFCCSYADAKSKHHSLVAVNELSVRIYSRSDSIDGIPVNLTDGHNVANLSSFDINLKTFIYIHGWRNSIDKPESILIKASLLNASDVNVLLLNWDIYSNTFYFYSRQCVEGVGNYLGDFLKDVQESYNYSLDNVTIVGFSLGAHIAGYAGKRTNGTLGVIVGLDPAGPLFYEEEKDNRLNENDAKYVQVIHTSDVLGVTYSLGHADFWPNGGFHQPGCGVKFYRCPHGRSISFYAESLLSDLFVARKCTDYEDYYFGKCNDWPKSIMGGINIDKRARGNYYLDTNDKSPFAKGDLLH